MQLCAIYKKSPALLDPLQGFSIYVGSRHMPKKKPPTHELFEAIYSHGKFTKITDSMMDSLAWQSLEPSQMGLYLLFKRKYTKNKSSDDNKNDISFPFSEYSKIKTYSNKRTFWRDLDALIEKGFIIIVSPQKFQRKPNIYGFSDNWKNYGKPDFKVKDEHKRLANKDK